MTAWALAYVRRHSHAWSRLRDYAELAKLRIAVMELVTVAVGAWLGAWGTPSPMALLHALIGTALVAASASAINQWLERASDRHMRRTADRPLAAGRINGLEVGVFAASTGLAGVAYLQLTVGPGPALVALLTWTLYSLVYTPLKRYSVLNTVVGAIAGALPVLIGWTAVGGQFDLLAGTLFLIVYLWQFPHFMAIAWLYRHEYAAAGLRMLPVIDPSGRRTGAQAFLAAWALVPVSLVPAIGSGVSTWYSGSAALLGLIYTAAALAFFYRTDDRSARRLLRASLVYLPLVLVALALAPLRATSQPSATSAPDALATKTTPQLNDLTILRQTQRLN
ncbi:MAG: heme o synthase [Pirellulales bacterium]|nr:heme o synthase [Pirellulales bacterium]